MPTAARLASLRDAAASFLRRTEPLSEAARLQLLPVWESLTSAICLLENGYHLPTAEDTARATLRHSAPESARELLAAIAPWTADRDLAYLRRIGMLR